MIHLTDQQLLQEVGSKNEEAIGVLFMRYHGELRSYGIKLCGDHMLVEDIIQEVFLKIIRKSETLGDVCNFRSYIFTVFRRDLYKGQNQPNKLDKIVDLYSSRSDIVFSEEDLASYPSYEPHHKKKLAEALNRLSWRQKEAILLRYYNNLSTNEISEIMGITNQTVLNTIYKGLKKLKSIATPVKAAGVISLIIIWFKEFILQLGYVGI